MGKISANNPQQCSARGGSWTICSKSHPCVGIGSKIAADSVGIGTGLGTFAASFAAVCLGGPAAAALPGIVGAAAGGSVVAGAGAELCAESMLPKNESGGYCAK